MKIYELNYGDKHNKGKGFYLMSDNWNDFGYTTTFSLSYYDGNEVLDIGVVKIATLTGNYRTTMNDIINGNREEIFSLGVEKEYYLALNKLEGKNKDFILKELNDIAMNEELFEKVKDLEITQKSLFRFTYEKTIKEQFRRILHNSGTFKKFHFFYHKDKMQTEFRVNPYSKPASNLHGLIGSNGLGKTTFLTDILFDFLGYSSFTYLKKSDDKDFFRNAIFISFSIFDNFQKLDSQKLFDDSLSNYDYIGVKKYTRCNKVENKNSEDFTKDFINSIKNIKAKGVHSKTRWCKAMELLETDLLIEEANIKEKIDDENILVDIFEKFSSGHKIIILTITKLIDLVVEKTLILLDEPESYLHPPLLATYIRTISHILMQQNGVCIVSTHSPVVMQEIDKECVHIIELNKGERIIKKPNINTYGENIGILTREVFNYEIERTGFYNDLKMSAKEGKKYEQILEDYNFALGMEAKSLLRILVRKFGDKE
ncbi:hypothetical protein ETI06_09760 [Macrococcoides goetzii]|nr:AAA family ATPase [Macrococcus goetzii]TDM48749.1 hypothetical protein ETI06_09760 [Macrococcus goetzii]